MLLICLINGSISIQFQQAYFGEIQDFAVPSGQVGRRTFPLSLPIRFNAVLAGMGFVSINRFTANGKVL